MDSRMTVRELRPIYIPTLAEARLLMPTLQLPRQLPETATFEHAAWFLDTVGGWESMAVHYRVGGGWLRIHQAGPAATRSLRAYAPTPRRLAGGRTVGTATLVNGCSLVDWQEAGGRRFTLTSDVLSVETLAAIADSVPVLHQRPE